MKSKILISILAIAFVSGCISEIPGLEGGVSLGGGAGLEITSFTAEPSPVYSGSTVRIMMETANQGGTTVADGDSLVYLTGSNFAAWKITGTTNDVKYDHFGKPMKAEDVVRGIPADTKRFSWSGTAPSVIAGQVSPATFIGRIYHKYITSANGNVWVYNETEAEAARTAGRTIYTPSFTYTKGPVGLTISVSPNPIILYSNENTFTMNIKISNLATGTIYRPDAVTYGPAGSENVALTADDLNNVTVQVAGTGLTIGDECKGAQQLVGKDLTLFCTVTVGSVPTFKSYSLNVNVSYGYYTERTLSVTVQGK
jgi:hypothetical protein